MEKDAQVVESWRKQDEAPQASNDQGSFDKAFEGNKGWNEDKNMKG